MKRILFMIAILLSVATDAQTPLVKMVNLFTGRHFNFEDDRITNITNADDVILYDFQYDELGRLTSLLDQSSQWNTYTYTWTYVGTTNIVAEFGSIPYEWNPQLNQYYRFTTTEEDGWIYESEQTISLTPEMLLDHNSTVWTAYSMEMPDDPETSYFTLSLSHSNQNLVGLYLYNQMDIMRSWDHTVMDNPVKPMFAAALRSMAFLSNDSWANPLFYSNKLRVKDGYAFEDPESSIYFYQVNEYNQPVTCYIQSYYFQQLENTNEYLKFYYEGDEMP